MSVKGEIFITANGSEIEGPRDNNSSLIFEFKNKLHFPFNDDGMLGDKEMSLFSIVMLVLSIMSYLLFCP